MTEAAPAPTTAKPRAPRVALWDHARLVLILLVVVGHSISTIRTDSSFAYGLDPSEWTPHKRECSLWQEHVGSSLLSTKTRP